MDCEVSTAPDLVPVVPVGVLVGAEVAPAPVVAAGIEAPVLVEAGAREASFPL